MALVKLPTSPRLLPWYQEMRAVAAATATNLSSMLQDRLAGRRTEIDALTGSLLALAEDQGLDLPTHRALYAQVKQFERT